VISFFAYELAALSTSPPPRQVTPIASAGSLRLTSTFGPAFAGEMVATKAGLFEREGLHIELRAGRDAVDPISSVVAGSDTFGVTRADSFLLARGKGAPIVAFAAGFIESPAAFYILKKSGLRTPWDFAGHRVGRRVGDDTSIVYDALIKKLGLPRSRISEVPVAADLSMLLRGDVDVWPGHVGDDDYALDRQGVDYFVIDPASYGVHLTGSVYFTRNRTITEQPELVRRFLKGLIAGWDMVYQDYAVSVPMIVSFDQERLTPDYVRFALDRQREYLRPIAVRYGEFTEDQWRSLQVILLTQRLLERTVDLPEAVTYEFLRDAYRKPYTFGK
jgi:ABC-type nitrate/sulfonate/bicarbonate transport system substrate-binding protein